MKYSSIFIPFLSVLMLLSACAPKAPDIPVCDWNEEVRHSDTVDVWGPGVYKYDMLFTTGTGTLSVKNCRTEPFVVYLYAPEQPFGEVSPITVNGGASAAFTDLDKDTLYQFGFESRDGEKLSCSFYVYGDLLPEHWLYISQNSVTPTGLTYTVENNGLENLTYGFHYSLKQRQGEDWVGADLLQNAVFHAKDYTLEAFQSKKLRLDWSSAYGQLPPGSYLLELSVKTISGSESLTAEFTVPQAP